MPGSTPEALNPESLGGAGTTSTTDSGAMPPPANGSTTTGASNSEQTSTRPGNSPKESSQTGLPGGTEPLPPGGNSAISGSTSTTPSTTNSEIGEEKGNYKRKLEETFNADKEAMGLSSLPKTYANLSNWYVTASNCLGGELGIAGSKRIRCTASCI